MTAPPFLHKIHHLGESYPALLYGIALLLGVASSLFDPWLSLAPISLFVVLGATSLIYRHWPLFFRFCFILLIGVSGYIFAIPYRAIPLPKQGVHGTGQLSLSNLRFKRTSTGYRWLAEGKLDHFVEDSGTIFSALPVHITFSSQEGAFLPTLTKKWKITGTLKPSFRQGCYLFKPDSRGRWIPLGTNWQGYLSMGREQAKNSVKKYLQNVMESSRSAPFLAAMLTGEFDDTVLRHHFGRFGLQHILAISGFHFSLLAIVFSLLFSLFLPRTWAAPTLVVVLTLYFIFLGISPSILRAWITIVLAAGASFFYRRSSGLNLLGIALIGAIIADPWSIAHIGFQCSFAITAGILLFCQPVESILEYWIPQRPLSITSQWTTFSQHVYIAACWGRKTLALTVAVNTAAVPLLLFHFHSFPPFSLLYNLFFPFFIAVAMVLLTLGTFLHAVFGKLGLWVHTFTGKFTYILVGLAADAPRSMDATLYFPEISPLFTIFLFTAIFTGGLVIKISQNSFDRELSFTL